MCAYTLPKTFGPATQNTHIFYLALPYWVILHSFIVVFRLFFKINFFGKIHSGTPSECQTVWIQIRTDTVSALIWVQTVCKGDKKSPLTWKELNIYEVSCIIPSNGRDKSVKFNHSYNDLISIPHHLGQDINR